MTDETDKVTNTDDPFYVVGLDSVTRSLSEHYYLPKDVDPDPFGAWMAIQNQSARIDELEAKLSKAEILMHDARTALDDVPEYHEQGMNCGLEDRCIGDPYEAMQFGWDQAMDRVCEEQVNLADKILRDALAELKGPEA